MSIIRGEASGQRKLNGICQDAEKRLSLLLLLGRKSTGREKGAAEVATIPWNYTTKATGCGSYHKGAESKT